MTIEEKMKKKNQTIKQVLNYLMEDKIISEGECIRIWVDYRNLHSKEMSKN